MPSANDAFQRDPLKFMKSNLVLPPMGSKHSLTKYVTLTLQNDCRCKSKLGSAWGKKLIDVYKLEFSTDQNNAFKIYWLPYKNNTQFHMVLSESARYMLTPMMDGCTFSHGGYDPKFPIVAHSNFQTDDGQIDQGAIDNKLGALFPPQSMYNALTKPDYTGSKHFGVGAGHVRSTTFGVFKNNVWNFYSHVWEDYHKAVAKKSALMNMDPTDPYFGSGGWDTEVQSAGKSYELLAVNPI
jgi:hypothetical protein